MALKRELFVEGASVKATMVAAHLDWASRNIAQHAARLAAALGPDDRTLFAKPWLATDWVPFRYIVTLDRAIAALAGGEPEHVFEELGRHSARCNLGGAYKAFQADDPHRFLERAALLHTRFQNFGRAAYVPVGPRAARLEFAEYPAYSPVFCTSERGYIEEALVMMHAPDPRVDEVSCACAGDSACVFDARW